MRGEHTARSRNIKPGFRSSPRARGTLVGATMADAGFPQIPACAGNTPEKPDALTPHPAHPRMRGGTPKSHTYTVPASPLIPAFAGNTCWASIPCRCGFAHPRLRGEHVQLLVPAPFTCRSSPHSRGTLPLQPETVGPVPLIPACAGNRPVGSRFKSIPLIPACAGNTKAQRAWRLAPYRSSPRARETRCMNVAA